MFAVCHPIAFRGLFQDFFRYSASFGRDFLLYCIVHRCLSRESLNGFVRYRGFVFGLQRLEFLVEGCQHRGSEKKCSWWWCRVTSRYVSMVLEKRGRGEAR